LFKSLNSKFLAIAAVEVAIVVTIFFLNELSIITLMILWNFGALGAIVLWERERRRQSSELGISYSDDERWTKIKMELERTEESLSKVKDSSKRAALIRCKARLENELRRLEWSIRESNMNATYNAGNTKLRNSESEEESRDSPERSQNDFSFEPSDRFSEKSAIRKRAQLEIENKERRNLESILKSAEAVISSEPAVSLPTALLPITNDCRAHYNLIKKRANPNSTILADYWVAWSLLMTVQKRLPFESNLEKYSSKEFASVAKKFMKSVDSVRYSKTESVPQLPNLNPHGSASNSTLRKNPDFYKSSGPN
jgi:hypothetical protein